MHGLLCKALPRRLNLRTRKFSIHKPGRPLSATFRTTQGTSQLLNGKARTGLHDIFRYPGEYAFNLSEYLVVLDKPIGLSLAPDPVTRQVVVQNVADGSTAAACKLIQVGDVVKKCSAAEGDDMVACADLKTVQTAMMNKSKQGKMKLVLERGKGPSPSTWCYAGKPGMASSARETLQLPVSLDKPASQLEVPVSGSCMLVGFHRHSERFAEGRSFSRIAARAAKTQELRDQLLAARGSPAIDLPAPRRSMNGNPVGLTPLESLTQPFVNAAWLVRGGRFAVNQKKVVAALPWLLVATKRLNDQDLTSLASQQALSCMMQLSLHVQSGVMVVRGTVNPNDSTPPAPLRSLIATAASLNRLKYRLESYLANQQWRPVSGGVLVHCDENMEADVATLLACWFHWYGGMELNESVRAAQDSMGARAQKGVVEEATELLVELGKERASQVLLTWPYGGLAADVCGELVGGWDVRVPLKRWPGGNKTSRPMQGQFFLELKGLKPGSYHYKYIVDGTWTVDHYAPKALDASGNWNNCLYVSAVPPIVTEGDRLFLARLEAAHLAFETKLGLPLRNAKK